MNEKKLQQDAFMWFKDIFGVVPKEKGLMMFTSIRGLFFIKSPSVIFAPDEETFKAVDNSLFIMLKVALSWSLFAFLLVIVCLTVCLSTIGDGSGFLGFLFGFFLSIALAFFLLTMFVLVDFYQIHKLLIEIYSGNVVIYTGVVGRDYKMNKKYLVTLLKEKIPQMNTSEIQARISILFDGLKDRYSPLKELEYEMLLAECKRRQNA